MSFVLVNLSHPWEYTHTDPGMGFESFNTREFGSGSPMSALVLCLNVAKAKHGLLNSCHDTTAPTRSHRPSLNAPNTPSNYPTTPTPSPPLCYRRQTRHLQQ
jgi:hypothetical protein